MSTAHRILVTGLSGFVGGILAQAAAARPDVTLVPLTLAGQPVDIRESADVERAVAEAEPTAVIHLAAIAHPGQAKGDPEAAWAVNVMGTLALAQAVRTHAPRARFVFAGSAEAYGEAFNQYPSPLSEEAPLLPRSPYGATKAAADMMLGQLAHEGLDTVRFRAFNHTAPGQPAGYVVPDFSRQIARIEAGLQKPVMTVGNLEAQRDFLDARDLVEAYLLAATGTGPSGAYNLASGRPVAIGAILETLLALSEAKITIESDPELMRPSEVPVVSGRPARAHAALGWRATTPLSRLLEDCLNAWRLSLEHEGQS